MSESHWPGGLVDIKVKRLMDISKASGRPKLSLSLPQMQGRNLCTSLALLRVQVQD